MRQAGMTTALVLGAHAVAHAVGSNEVRSALGAAEQPVLDFLLSEAFTSLDEGVRRLLLCTYEEPRLTAARAQILTGDLNAGTLLSALASAGLLISAYADEATNELVFTFHPLLVELLRRRTVSDGEELATVAAAHRRASFYHAAQGESGLALNHAISARDPAITARLLLEHGPSLVAAGDAAPIRDALTALAEDLPDRYPELQGVMGHYRRLIGDANGALAFAARSDTGTIRSFAPLPRRIRKG